MSGHQASYFSDWVKGGIDAAQFITIVQMGHSDRRKKVREELDSEIGDVCGLGAALRSLFELAIRMYRWSHFPNEEFHRNEKCNWDSRRNIKVHPHPVSFCSGEGLEQGKRLLGTSKAPVSFRWLNDTWWALSAMAHMSPTALPLDIFHIHVEEGLVTDDITLTIKRSPWAPEQRDAVEECFFLIDTVFFNAVEMLTARFTKTGRVKENLKEYGVLTDMKRLPPADPDSPLPPGHRLSGDGPPSGSGGS